MIFGIALSTLVALITFTSFLPMADKHALHTRGRFHPLGHLLAFASIGFGAAMTPRTFRGRIVLILCALALGFGIEVAEHLVFKISLEWPDVFMDSMGVFSGVLAALLSRPRADFSGQF